MLVFQPTSLLTYLICFRTGNAWHSSQEPQLLLSIDFPIAESHQVKNGIQPDF